MAGRVRSSRSRVRGEMEVKYRWKKMVCRIAEWSGQDRSGQSGWRGLRTFDDVLDAGQIGEDVQMVLWPAAGVHGRICPQVGCGVCGESPASPARRAWGGGARVPGFRARVLVGPSGGRWRKCVFLLLLVSGVAGGGMLEALANAELRI